MRQAVQSVALRARPGLLAVWLAACVGTTAREADRPYTAGLAAVETVVAEVSDAAPPRVVLRVEGLLPDPCTRLEPARTEQRGPRFELVLPTRRDFGAGCKPAPVPFVTRLPLRATLYESGTYFASVNGVSTDFVVIVDPAEQELYRRGLFD
ncbi:MAG: hypothetical protein QNK04_27460 [Myxococcota bacterium]|nr:hypothetical protein [Myxococcota bacterium]